MDKELTIASTIGNLHLIEQAVDEILMEHGISDDVYANLMVASMEAANNAITHGNKLNPAKHATFHFNVDNGVLELTVKDEGPGFDYAHLPDPTTQENIENMSGRGVFLMTKLSDEIEFADNGSFVRMKFFLSKDPA